MHTVAGPGLACGGRQRAWQWPAVSVVVGVALSLAPTVVVHEGRSARVREGRWGGEEGGWVTGA